MKLGTTAARVDGSARGIRSQIKGSVSRLGWHHTTKVAEATNQTPSKVEASSGGSPDTRRNGSA
jgi:hypothetical protein